MTLALPDAVVMVLSLERPRPVLPINVAAKKPFVKWGHLQTQLPTGDEIERWVRGFRPQVWAQVCGEFAGVVTLDFDGAEGADLYRTFGLVAHRRTGSGGFHIEFTWPGWRVKTLNRTTCKTLGRRFPGLDIRGDGGYAAICGRNAKGPYQWLRDPVPYPWQDMPEEVRLFIRDLNFPKPARPPSPQALPTNGERVPAAVLLEYGRRMLPEGRNNAGILLAMQLRDNGYTQAEAEPVMLEFRRLCPPTNAKGQIEEYAEAEALASLASAYSAPARSPWERQAPRLRQAGSLRSTFNPTWRPW